VNDQLATLQKIIEELAPAVTDSAYLVTAELQVEYPLGIGPLLRQYSVNDTDLFVYDASASVFRRKEDLAKTVEQLHTRLASNLDEVFYGFGCIERKSLAEMVGLNPKMITPVEWFQAAVKLARRNTLNNMATIVKIARERMEAGCQKQL
jgi:hypothetical protein